MEFEQSKAISNLLKKLTALRITLSTEERAALDAIVTRTFSSPDEMQAHRMTADAATEAVDKQTLPAANPRITQMRIMYDENTKAYKVC